MRGEARLFGVLGDPVDHSLSPVMQNAAFAAERLPHLYLRFRVPPPALPAAFDEARRLGVGGLNLTVPLKEAALPLVDVVTPEAERVGAVNTVVFDGDRLVGDNTDARGFLRALGGRVDLPRSRVVLIGAGGSARAVGMALASAGCRHVTVANRTIARAEDLALQLAATGGMQAAATALEALVEGTVLADARLVVNTTSTGLGDVAVPVRYGAAPPTCLFMDLVYGPRPTAFLRAAARARRPVLDGGGMLLHQGALAFEAWTGRRAPLESMRRALGAVGLTIAASVAMRTRGA